MIRSISIFTIWLVKFNPEYEIVTKRFRNTITFTILSHEMDKSIRLFIRPQHEGLGIKPLKSNLDEHNVSHMNTGVYL